MKLYRTIAAATLVAAAMAYGPDAGARDLVYGSWVPPRHALNRALIPVFAAIKKDTNGSLNWILKPGAQLFSGRAALVSTGKGLADASGPIVTAFTRSNLKNVLTINELFAFGKDPMAAIAAATETILLDCPQCLADYKKNNTVFLGGDGTTEQNLMCRGVVKTLADVKNLKLRTTGAAGRVARSMNGIPVSMTAQDMIEAISRGQIDCIVGPMTWMISYPIMDSIKSVVDYPFGINTTAVSFLMNRDTWLSLSPSERKVMLKYAPEVTARKIVTFVKEHDLGRQQAIKRGIVVTKGGADFAAMLDTHRKTELIRAAETARKIGAKDPETVTAAFFKNLEKWEEIIAKMPVTIDAYKNALREVIYTRVDINHFD